TARQAALPTVPKHSPWSTWRQVHRSQYAQIGRLHKDHLTLTGHGLFRAELPRDTIQRAQCVHLAHNAILVQPSAAVLARIHAGDVLWVVDDALHPHLLCGGAYLRAQAAIRGPELYRDRQCGGRGNGSFHLMMLRSNNNSTAIDHQSRGEDASAEFCGVSLLALGRRSGGERVAPTEMVPVVYVPCESQDVRLSRQLSKQCIGGRAGGTALGCEQLQHDRMLRCRQPRAIRDCAERGSCHQSAAMHTDPTPVAEPRYSVP